MDREFMFDLFRFVLLRPAGTREPHEIISTGDDTDFQQQLERDRERPSPGGRMEKTADRFLESPRAVTRGDSLAFGKAYDALSASLRADAPANRADLLREIREAFDRDAGDVVQDQGFSDDRQRLADTLIAAKLGTPRIDLPLDLVARDLRLVALIQRAADGDAHLDDADGISAALDASIALPDGLLPLDQPAPAAPGEGGERPPGERPPEGPTDERRRLRDQALREYRELSEAHDFLRDLSPEHVGDVAGPASTTPGTGEGGAERPPSHDGGEIHEAIFREIHALREALDVHRTVAEGVVAAGLTTSPTQILQGTTLRIRREVLAEAPQAVHAGLRAARVDLTTMSLSDAVDRIDARRRELAPLVLDDLTGAEAAGPGGANVSLVGGQFLPTDQVPDLTMRDPRRHDA